MGIFQFTEEYRQRQLQDKKVIGLSNYLEKIKVMNPFLATLYKMKI